MWLLFVLSASAMECPSEPLDGTAYAFSEGVNLRMEPSTAAAVVSQLSFGTAVIIRGVGLETMIGGHRDRWYRVSVPRPGDISLSGHMFGSTLAVAVMSGDLDGDGEAERVLAMPGAESGVMVRVQDHFGTVATWEGGAGERACAIDLLLDEGEPTAVMVSQGTWQEWLVYSGSGLQPAVRDPR